MSPPLTCDAVDRLTAELALDVLDGDDRAAVLDHVATCARCRRELVELSAVADALLHAVPAFEPPAGFEDRVLRQAPVPRVPSGPAAGRSRRRPAVLVGAVAAVLVVAIAVGALVVTRGRSPDDGVRTAAMVTPDHRVVGRVVVLDAPTALVVALPGWESGGDHAGADDYSLRVTLRSGRTVVLGPAPLAGGYGGFGPLRAAAAGDVATVELIERSGRVSCSAALG